MQIPETDNIHFQYAFKTGYRLALEGKSMASMPSAIRCDLEMRDYFQQGWEQAQQDVEQGLLYNVQPCWKCRFIWGIIMILGGAATAYSIIYSYEKEQTELAQRAQIQQDQQMHATEQSKPETHLSALSEQQRTDLLANLAEQAQRMNPLPPLKPVVPNNAPLSQAVFTTQVHNKTPVNQLSDKIPKYIRKIHFLTQIKVKKPQRFYHRWRFNDQYLNTTSFNLTPDNTIIWSTQKMSSAWQGRWDVEVLNHQQEVIYRKTFTYGVQK